MTFNKIQHLSAALVSFSLLSGFLFGKQDDAAKAEEAPAAAVVETPATAPEIGETTTVGDQQGTVVYKFENNEEMREFAGLWQQRRGIITRMAVLEAYLSEEAARIDEINRIFTEEYGIDMDRRFVLDSDMSILVELELPESSEREAPPSETE